ncbi:hypothetical protein PM082_016028 [Marasmius tenuissimus]|nr:hypothetical protein PM082_016028 [Marasmius tenuissimus]
MKMPGACSEPSRVGTSQQVSPEFLCCLHEPSRIPFCIITLAGKQTCLWATGTTRIKVHLVLGHLVTPNRFRSLLPPTAWCLKGASRTAQKQKAAQALLADYVVEPLDCARTFQEHPLDSIGITL